MKIAIATDHNGVNEKQEIINKLVGYEVIDMSTDNNPTDDYPDFAFKVGEAVRDHLVDYGVLLCGTGIGISIACNKVKGIRCAKIDNEEEAKITRKDNDSNIVALNENLDAKTAIKIIDSFINTKASNEEKHVRRINKITKYEEEHER